MAVLCAALFAAAWAVLEARARRDHSDRTDEPEWIAISILHWNQFVRGAPPAGAELDDPDAASSDPWAQGVQHTVFGYMNPCLPKLILGGVLAAGGYTDATPQVFEIFHRDDPRAGRRAQAAMEPAMPLARRVIQALAALSAVLVFLAARAVAPRPRSARAWVAAVFAGALFLASPLVLHTATYIRTDFFMVPFVLAGLLVAFGLRHELAGARGPRAAALSAAALGCVCGLAVASKLNGTLVCFCAALWIALWTWSARAPWSRAVLGVALTAALAVLVFYALDPRLWRHPVEGVLDILARWDRQMDVQQQRGARMNVEVARTLGERLHLFLDRTLGRDDAWRSLTGLRGGALLALGGLLVAAAEAARGGRDARARALALLAFVGVMLAGTALWLPLDWERFFLPAAPAMALAQGHFLGWLAGWGAGHLGAS